MGYQPVLILLLTLYRAIGSLAFDNGPPTKEYDFNVTLGSHAPVGISREVFLINNLSPGPTIEVDQDDWVIIRTQNQSPHNISIHFHGLEMSDTPWSDGVPGISQRAIQPRERFTYKFQAKQQGSYWYHAHYRAQIEDGLTGAIVIHPRQNDPKPFNLISNDTKAVNAMIKAEREVQPLLITDWTRLTSTAKQDLTHAARIEIPCYDALLFNGKGNVECLGPDVLKKQMSTIQRTNLDTVPGSVLTDKGCLPPKVVTNLFGGSNVPVNESAIPDGIFSGCNPTKGAKEVIKARNSPWPEERWVAIDLIGAMNLVRGAISIDGHDMWVYAMDGPYVQPQKVQALVLGSGDRFSVLVNTNQPGAFKIRVHALSVGQIITGHALLSVGGSLDVVEASPYINLVGAAASPGVKFFNETTAAPFPIPPKRIPRAANQTFILNMIEDDVTYLWAMNTTRLMPEDFEDETPILFNPHPEANNNVTITTRFGEWIDLIFVANETPFPPHPIHKHGNKIHQLGSGTGPFRWPSVEAAANERPQLFNFNNPPRRDTWTSPGARDGVPAWIAIRYHAIVPGAWLLHCHIANHMAGGMSMIIQDAVDKWPKVPAEYLAPNSHI
ncbi:hypothetical protein V2G26_001546 [Clonostachys chloroleuca]